MKPGLKVQGKWSGVAFEVESLLGVGANGSVYLVKTPYGRAAMKVCSTSADAALEWSVLTTVHKAGADAFPKPMVMDDGPPEAPFFYVMEWIDGEPLTRVIERHQWPQVKSAVEQILAALMKLHHTGHSFCDLKPDNILVTNLPGSTIRFVDVGGVTAFGRAVRQYTPQTDRAYYGFGTRKSEVLYDLAALALSVLLTWQRADVKSTARMSIEERRRWIERVIATFPNRSAGRLFQLALSGDVPNAESFLSEWKQVDRQVVASRDWTEWVMWISIGSAASAALVTWVTFLS